MKSFLGSGSRLAALAGAVCVFSLVASPLRATTVSTGFESGTDGTYTAGGDVIGKQDTSLGGTWTSIWTTPPTGIIYTTSNSYAGSSALQIVGNQTARGAQIQIANASSLLSSPFTFSLAMNIESIATPISGQQVQVQFGSSTFGSGSNWLKFGYDGFHSSTTGTDRQTYFFQAWNGTALTPKYIDLSSVANGFGEYVTFNFTIDPTTHTYTSASITGSKGTVSFDITGLLSWDGSTTPSNYLNIVTGANDTVTVDFDNVTISSVPEPTTLGLACGGVLLLASLRRKNRRY